MSTRANVYVCNEFIAEIPSDAYPGGEFWDLIKHVDNGTESEFRKAVLTYMKGYEYGNDYDHNDYLPPASHGVGNWSYEYCWYPTKQPKEYRDWDHWVGNILVRKIDDRLTWGGERHSYWQVPGPWKLISEIKCNDIED